MTKREDIEDDELLDIDNLETHSIVTAEVTSGEGYAAWVEDEYDDARAIAESRWEAIYHLAVVLCTGSDDWGDGQ